MWVARASMRAVLRSGGLLKNHRLPSDAVKCATIHASTTLADQDRIYTSEQREIVLEKLNTARTDQEV
ncbi:unnamed protein product, partial [Nesidiocoris tenuis]